MQTFNVNSLNQLTTATRDGTLTVAGTVGSPNVTPSVTVSGTGLTSGAATMYGDGTWARAGATLVDGANSYTATATDTAGRSSVNSVSFTLPATVTFTYDGNGNLTSDGSRTFEYDFENQLTNVYVATKWRSEFVYDTLMRRRVRKEYTWQGGAWVQTNEVRYVYDQRLVGQERWYNPQVSLSTPQKLITYTRGTDLSRDLQEAGGIGGLLARSDSSLMQSDPVSAHVFYATDANGNVTALLSSQNTILARYQYDPYGNVISMSGPMADVNLYRFSSKEVHPNSGLVYYLYRYYGPNLQRWMNRDPLGDIGGLVYQASDIVAWNDLGEHEELTEDQARNAWVAINGNLYGAIGNDPVNGFDPFGLERVLVCTRPGPSGMPVPIYADKETLRNASIGAPTENAPTGSSDLLAKQYAKTYLDLAALAGAQGVASLGKQLPTVGQKLFGGGGVFNSNRYLRVGFSRDGGRRVFRIAGDWVGKFKKDPHITLKDCGPL